MRVAFAIGIGATVVLLLIVVAWYLQIPHFNAMSVEAAMRIGEEVIDDFSIDGEGKSNHPLRDGSEDPTQYGSYTVVAYRRTDGSEVQVDLRSRFGWWYFRFAIGPSDFSAQGQLLYHSPSKEHRRFRVGPDSKWIEDDLESGVISID